MACNTAAAQAQQRDTAARAAKYIRLALFTHKSGEAHVAIGALKRALAAVGLDLHGFAQIVEAGMVSVPVRPPDGDLAEWRSRAWFCHHRLGQLREREGSFVDSLLRNYSEISPKQMAPLHGIGARLRWAGAR
jgi:hypothetical protein